MKKLACLLSLLLIVALSMPALAEDLKVEAVDIPIDETEVGFGQSEEEATSVGYDGESDVPAVIESITYDAAPDALMDEAQADEALFAVGEAMAPVRLTISRNATKKVYAGVPYQIAVKGRKIKSCSSNNAKVATVTGDGRLTIHAAGKARVTIRTGKKKFTLTLKALAAPAPGDCSVRLENGNILLNWSSAKYATGYEVQISQDGANWTEVATVGTGVTSADVTASVTGASFLRVVALLGDAYGGASADISVFGPARNVRVICEESYLYGPTDRLNVQWDGTVGASAYNVYRATLPSEDYQLIGTTTDTYFPDTRSATELYAYRVQPVCNGAEVASTESATLWTGLQGNVLPPSDLESKSGIILLVNKRAQVVTAYVQDANGAYTIPLRHMICSSGAVYDRTKNGTYTLKARTGEWYRYPSGVYIRYPSIYRDGYYFHSPLYHASKDIMSSTVAALGTRQSLGCIRLKMRDAAWVYKHCPAGTLVYICDGAKRDKLKEAIRPQKVKVKGF